MLVDSDGEGFPATAPNAEKLPYSVRFEGWRLYLRLCGYGAGVLFGAFVAFSTLFDSRGKNSLLGLATFLFLAAFCAVQLWRLRRPVAVLYPDRIEKPLIVGVAVLHRTKIEGVGKLVSTRYGSYFDIVSNSATEPDIRLDGAFREHPIVAEWLRGATDPEAEAKKAERARILADARYGATWAERERLLKWVNVAAIVFNLACAALAIWLWFGASLNDLTLLLAFAPVLAAWGIVAASKDLVVWASSALTRPQVVGALAPPLTLAVHTAFTAHVLETSPLLVASAVIAVAAAILLYLRLVTSASRLQSAIFSGALIGFAAYGLALAADVALDHAPGQVFATIVLDKRESHGKSTRHYLDLSGWSDRPAGEVSVSSSEYEIAVVGFPICVERHPGALRLAWFSVAQCPPGDLKPVLNGELRTARQYSLRGNLLLDRGEYRAALADLERALALDPNSSIAFADVAVAQAWLGDDAEARSNADTALALNPRQHIAFHARAIVDAGNGQTAEALANLDRAIAINPRDRFAWNRRLLINQNLQNYSDALKDGDALLAFGADSAWLRGRLASIHLALHDGRGALEEADAWIANAPKDPAGYVIRGNVLVFLDRRSEAEAAFDRAVQGKPTAAAYTARARFRAREAPSEALKDVDAALKLEPGAYLIRLLRAELLVRAGRRDEAAEAYTALRQAGAGSPIALNDLCYSQATVEFSLDRALQDCEAALALSPRTPSFLDSKGFALLRLGRAEEAITALDGALALNPRLAPSLFTRGVAELRLGRRGEGEADLAAARALAPRIDAQFAEYGVAP